MMTFLLFIAGLAMLTFGAEILVRGAGQMAARLGVAPLIIGLTVVAFGTSAPELAVSLKSAFVGQADLAVGNVVGSNIFNILVIIGLSAIIIPLSISRQILNLDLGIMVSLTLVTMAMAFDGQVSRLEGALLFVGIVAYLTLQFFLARRSRNGGAQETEETEVDGIDVSKIRPVAAGFLLDGLLVVGGLVLLVLGARWLVAAAVEIARGLGVSELVIGLTIIAAGTSMPEVAASVAAALKGQRDLAVGNVVGSNVFNLCAVLGMTAAVAPGGIAVSPMAIKFDIPVMVLATLACIPVFWSGQRVNRTEGGIFLAIYALYTGALIGLARGHIALPW